VDAYKRAFKRAVSVLKETRAPFVYQQSYNANNPRDDPTDFGSYYVGDDYADMVCVSLYNFGNTPGYGAGKPFKELVDRFYTQVWAGARVHVRLLDAARECSFREGAVAVALRVRKRRYQLALDSVIYCGARGRNRGGRSGERPESKGPCSPT
jgi:hypothetical protein